MEFLTCLQTRRSVRRFTAEPVSREVLSRIVERAQYAPSWKNSQTVRYVMVDDPEKKAQIAEEAVLGFGQNANIIRQAAALLVLSTVHGISGYQPDGTASTWYNDMQTSTYGYFTYMNYYVAVTPDGEAESFRSSVQSQPSAPLSSYPSP